MNQIPLNWEEEPTYVRRRDLRKTKYYKEYLEVLKSCQAVPDTNETIGKKPRRNRRPEDVTEHYE